jgi:hypothetical protein
MKTFDFYEFTGILVPGAITIVAILLIFPQVRTSLFSSDLTVGDLGLFVVLAYAAGHLTQAVGNGVEWVLWRVMQGLPTDWVRTRTHPLLADTQIQALQAKLSSELNVQTTVDEKTLSAGAWFSITRQIYAATAAQSRNNRVDIFNGNYGLNRGIASALLIGLILFLFTHGFIYWQIILLILLSTGVALYRMYRFGIRYARELFVQFLQLPTGENISATPTEPDSPADKEASQSPKDSEK